MNTYKVKANDNTGFWEIHDVSGFVSKTESESTAKLFAAAPELLEALKGVLASLEWHADQHGNFGMDAQRRLDARAAIAKAKGEQQ